MFDFSFSEILIIGLVAVIVLDPRHLPGVARSAGQWMGRARRFMNKMKEDLDGQVGTEHLAPLRELNQEWQRTKSMLQDQAAPTEEWEQSLGDEGQNRPESMHPRMNASARPGRRRRGRRRPPARVAATQDTPRKSHGGGEGV